MPPKTKREEQVVSAADEIGWMVSIIRTTGYDHEKTEYEFETWSPAGEDLIVSAHDDTLIRDLWEEAVYFDIDEHVSMWLQAKMNGDSSVPGAVQLVDDAREIEKMLYELYEGMKAALEKGDSEDADEV